MPLDPVTAVLDIGGKLIDRLWPDPTQANAAKLELLKLQQSGELAQMTGQLDINKIEAASSSVFVAGWRPFIGWTCGAALIYTFLLYPLLQWAAVLHDPHMQIPVLINMDMLWELMFGMLGFGGLRTFEKIKGVTK